MIATDLSTILIIPNREFEHLASEEQLMQAAAALEAHGMHAVVVDTPEQARALVAGLLPPGATVYDPPSETIRQIGLLAELDARTDLVRVRTQVQALDRSTQQPEIRR